MSGDGGSRIEALQLVLPVHLVASGERFGIDLGNQPAQFAVLSLSLSAPVASSRVDVAHHAVQAGVGGAIHLAMTELELPEASYSEGNHMIAESLPWLGVVLDVAVEQGQWLRLAAGQHRFGAGANLVLPFG